MSDQQHVLGTEKAMRVDRELCSFKKKIMIIKRGVRQGCLLSPDLFSLNSEIILQNLEEYQEMKVGGHNVNNLRYADDTVLIAKNKKKTCNN